MKKLPKIAIIIVLFSVVAPVVSAFAEGIEEGKPFENFTLKNGLTGVDVNFESQIKGKAKLTAIIFANSSCGACRKEMSTLSNLSAKNKDVVTYVILVDMNGEEIIGAFSKRFDFDVTYLLDPDFTVPPTYGFYFTPSLLIVDEKGVIVYKKGGYNIKKDEEVVTQKIQDLLK
jgi:peroxiredoxin